MLSFRLICLPWLIVRVAMHSTSARLHLLILGVRLWNQTSCGDQYLSLWSRRGEAWVICRINGDRHDIRDGEYFIRYCPTHAFVRCLSFHCDRTDFRACALCEALRTLIAPSRPTSAHQIVIQWRARQGRASYSRFGWSLISILSDSTNCQDPWSLMQNSYV